MNLLDCFVLPGTRIAILRNRSLLPTHCRPSYVGALLVRTAEVALVGSAGVGEDAAGDVRNLWVVGSWGVDDRGWGFGAQQDDASHWVVAVYLDCRGMTSWVADVLEGTFVLVGVDFEGVGS